MLSNGLPNRHFSHGHVASAPVSCGVVGYKFFQPSSQRPAGREHKDTEFAATVQSLPASTFELDLPDTLPPGPASQPPSGPLTEPPGEGDHDSRPATDAESAHPTLSHIGRYALKQQLGQGGLGRVFEAWDPLLSRTVAVKTLQFDIDTPSRVSLDGLFLNEARLAAGLSHPNIVTIFDAGLSAHGVYIAMERLHGRDLRQALQGGWRPTPAVAVLLARRVADGLAYAHARGIVHCDIKPANIHLGRKDKPKILDFGIARAAHGSALPALDGMVAGSPHYLAPEQLLGGTIDARSDIYALGVVLYELLSGRKAFEGDSLAAISAAALAGQATPVHEVMPGVPASLSELVARAMARDPAERQATAAELSLELRRWLEQDAAAASQAAARKDVPAVIVASRSRPAARWTMWAGGAAGLLAAALLLWVTLGPGAPEPGAAAAPDRPPARPPATAPEAPVDTTSPPAPVGMTEMSVGTTDPAPSTPAAAAPPTAAPQPRARPRPAPAVRAVTTTPLAVQTGSVQLAISPWGHVEVNGSPAGTTPPLARLTLPEGTHTITVRNEDFAPHTATVEVTADKPVTVRHRF
jgi:eukaryotic-like serine/threonine-protein kinase